MRLIIKNINYILLINNNLIQFLLIPTTFIANKGTISDKISSQ